MFVLPDLYVLYIIEDFFDGLRNNPEKLNYVLSSYARFDKMVEKTGDNYINECVSYIYDNRLKFVPGYDFNEDSFPCISTISYTDEKNQFIGDTGFQDIMYNELQNQQRVVIPTVYQEFSAVAQKEEVLFVPQEYNLIRKIWRNIFITNQGFSSQLTGMKNTEIKISNKKVPVTALYLDKKIPSLDKKLWKAQTGPQEYIASLGASQDHATILIKLITTGDYSLHRLFILLLRYALKASRLSFEEAGLQNSTFSFQMPQEFSSSDKVFETNVIMSALITDHWIDKFQKTRDTGVQVVTELVADNDKDQEVLIGTFNE